MSFASTCAVIAFQHRDRERPKTYWKPEGYPNLFTCEHLPTCTVLCVPLCTSAPGLRLRGTDKAVDADVDELHPSSVSFSGFLFSSSAFTNCVSLWESKDNNIS